MKSNHIWALFILFFMACSNTSSDPVMNELFQLNTNAAKRAYLENIFRDDQGKNESIPINVGELNRKRIFGYLDLYGHPSKIVLGEQAAMTPWLVIHHDMSDKKFDNRKKYFPILFQAYLNGDIRDNEMTLYLNRFYELKFGDRFAMNNPYRSEDEISQLIGLLQLEPSSK